MDGAPWREVLPPTLRLLDVEHRVKAMNWKVLVEQFLEGYHIRSTHRTTFFPVQYDNLNVVETFGSNSRITYPYRNIERLRDRPPSTWTVKARLTFVYQLFPNVMVATFPDRVVVIVVDPVSVDRSNLVNYVMTDADADRPPPVRPPATEAEGRTMGELAAIEDNAMSTAVQRGLASRCQRVRGVRSPRERDRALPPIPRRSPHCIVQPPSIVNVAPWMKLASSDAR